jgi:class 3 adenylate cyclase
VDQKAMSESRSRIENLPAKAIIGEAREFAFLSTDIVGSSVLHRRHPNDTFVAMDLHDRLLHSAIRRFGGNPFKHTGDGVIAVFDNAADAAHAAIAAQHDMRAAQWSGTGRLQVRCGVHVGVARARGNDFFGLPLSMLSRLEGAACSDQILISDIAVRRIAAQDHAAFSFLDLGEHHFKGVEKLRVFSGGRGRSAEQLRADRGQTRTHQWQSADQSQLLSWA